MKERKKCWSIGTDELFTCCTVTFFLRFISSIWLLYCFIIFIFQSLTSFQGIYTVEFVYSRMELHKFWVYAKFVVLTNSSRSLNLVYGYGEQLEYDRVRKMKLLIIDVFRTKASLSNKRVVKLTRNDNCAKRLFSGYLRYTFLKIGRSTVD